MKVKRKKFHADWRNFNWSDTVDSQRKKEERGSNRKQQQQRLLAFDIFFLSIVMCLVAGKRFQSSAVAICSFRRAHMGPFACGNINIMACKRTPFWAVIATRFFRCGTTETAVPVQDMVGRPVVLFVPVDPINNWHPVGANSFGRDRWFRELIRLKLTTLCNMRTHYKNCKNWNVSHSPIEPTKTGYKYMGQ